MEHLYVVGGNEFGADIDTKRNFFVTDKVDALEYFEKLKTEDFGCMLVHVDNYGKEKILETFCDE